MAKYRKTSKKYQKSVDRYNGVAYYNTCKRDNYLDTRKEVPIMYAYVVTKTHGENKEDFGCIVLCAFTSEKKAVEFTEFRKEKTVTSYKKRGFEKIQQDKNDECKCTCYSVDGYDPIEEISHFTEYRIYKEEMR